MEIDNFVTVKTIDDRELMINLRHVTQMEYDQENRRTHLSFADDRTRLSIKGPPPMAENVSKEN